MLRWKPFRRDPVDPVAHVLAECLERIEAGESPDEVVARYPDLRQELEPLLATGLHARAVAPEQPDPDFRRRLRYRLEGAVPVAARLPRPAFGLWRARLASAAVTLLFLLLVAGGAIRVSAGSLPDSPLYPLKRATEDAHLALTPDLARRFWLRLDFAERRLVEAHALWARKGVVWEGGLLEMVGITEAVLEEYEVFADPGMAEGVRRLRALGERQRAFLEFLAREAPSRRARWLAAMLLHYTADWDSRAKAVLERMGSGR
ncbi:MAG: DUF5667 domain-containing protein [Ardenticatenia bacterium]|nr:DUF5667 domain-containing protein [Ardenticatenia bacterium]